MKLLAVQALALDRAVEALNPSVRPGVIRLGPGMADPQRCGSLFRRAKKRGDLDALQRNLDAYLAFYAK